MMTFSSFDWARSRWRTMVGLAIVLLALATGAIAAATYVMAIDDLQARSRQSIEEAAAKSRLWLTGAARVLSAAAQFAGGDDKSCQAALGQAVAAREAFGAVRLDLAGGSSCAEAREPELAGLAQPLGERLRAQPTVALARGLALSVASTETQGRIVLALQVAAPDGKSVATALVDPGALSGVIALAPLDGAVVALMAAGQAILAAGGAAASDSTWLPANKTAVGASYQTTVAQARSGAVFTYAAQPVLGPDVYILGRFSNSQRDEARVLFLALAVAAAALVGLSLAFAATARAELLRGVGAIMAAMPARNAERSYRPAPEGEGMPSELRELAAAYNEMAREAASREQSLQASLTENQFLLRELNHRVKSSLQIIQSYVSLTRRLDHDAGRQTSAAAIEARVLVLSAAYRKAFSEGRMRNVRIRQFAEEIIANLSRLFERPGVTLELKVNVVAALTIDHAIPLGLVMVETMIAGMNAESARRVLLAIDQLEDLKVEMCVWTDGVPRAGELNPKLMAGLALQLGAIVEDPEPGAVVHWRFQGLPPPIIAAHADPLALAQPRVPAS